MLHHRVWGQTGPLVVALHGITSSSGEFELLGPRPAEAVRRPIQP